MSIPRSVQRGMLTKTYNAFIVCIEQQDISEAKVKLARLKELTEALQSKNDEHFTVEMSDDDISKELEICEHYAEILPRARVLIDEVCSKLKPTAHISTTPITAGVSLRLPKVSLPFFGGGGNRMVPILGSVPTCG